MKRGREDGGTPNPPPTLPLGQGQETKYRRVVPKPSEEAGADVKPPVEAFGLARPNQPAIASPILMAPPHYQMTYPPIPTNVAPPPPPPPASPAAATTAAANRNNREVKFENALDFLDQVKLVFAKQPTVYNQFLEIMKEFKTQAIDTPGVIARVSELFRGHRNLILGFNTFLPAGFKIEYEEPTPPPPPPVQLPKAPPLVPLPPPALPPMGLAPTTALPGGMQAIPQAPGTPQRKQPELDHARNYVKKIKCRFANQPQIYKSFLEILHAYHRENHTIKDVYDQVATLFHNHSDLLEEFTQFLPDPSPPVPTQPIVQQRGQKPRRKISKREEKLKEKEKEKEMSREPKESRDKDKEKGSKRSKKTDELRRHDDERPYNATYEEFQFFYHIRQKINNPEIYTEFLRCLNLYSLDIFNKMDLVIMVRDLWGRKFPGLFEQFKQFIHFNEPLAEPETKQQPTPPSHWMEIDFSTCKRYGPSYRALPKNYPQPICSERTELGRSVLNDTWVSVPTGSEDFTFKNSRKNQYEEMLFKCEDDRFELDLVIELNASAMRALEGIQRNISKMKKEELAKFKLEPLSVLHAKSIERLYGDRRKEIIEGLYNNPVVAVPVILRRLKQKDQEWRKARLEWNKIWREINEKNYHKSLDHQSFYFKQLEKKNLSPKVLIAEIKQRYQERLKSKVGPVHHLLYSLDDPSIVKEISALLTFVGEKTMSTRDRDKLDTFLLHFVQPFFGNKEDDTDDISEDQDEEEEEEEMDTVSPRKEETPNGKGKSADEPASNKDSAVPMEEDESHKSTSSTVENDVEEKKPLQNGTEVNINGTSQQKPKTKEDSLRLFYGNNNFYIFFRLYQILYERLAKAKEMAKSIPQENGDRPSVQVLLGKSKPDKDGIKDKYQLFLKYLRSLLSGELDQPRFEDDIREMFGISSYPLFTLDKLVSQLSKQLQTLLTDDTCAKLLNLYAHHEEGSSNRDFLESIYHANVLEILGEEKCYRFEFEPISGGFSIQLLDSSHQPRFAELSFSKDKWREYVIQYVQSDSADVDVRKHHIFLVRNKKKNITSKVLDDVVMENNLECKICLTSYRLFYVQGTEDFFYRHGNSTRGKERATAQKLAKKAKFYKWLKSKGCDVPDIEVPAKETKGPDNTDTPPKTADTSSTELMDVTDKSGAPPPAAEPAIGLSEGPKTAEFVQPLLTTPEPTPFLPPSPAPTPASSASASTSTPTPVPSSASNTTQPEQLETAVPQQTGETQQTAAKE